MRGSTDRSYLRNRLDQPTYSADARSNTDSNQRSDIFMSSRLLPLGFNCLLAQDVAMQPGRRDLRPLRRTISKRFGKGATSPYRRHQSLRSGHHSTLPRRGRLILSSIGSTLRFSRQSSVENLSFHRHAPDRPPAEFSTVSPCFKMRQIRTELVYDEYGLSFL